MMKMDLDIIISEAVFNNEPSFIIDKQRVKNCGEIANILNWSQTNSKSHSEM